ncbi:MAG: glycerol-3-phosphate 1-O-acyltransferase PlsB [Gammaproteobacteria bacterium]
MNKTASSKWQKISQAVWRRLITTGIRPWVSGDESLPARRAADPNVVRQCIVYAQASQSLADALIVEKAVSALNARTQIGDAAPQLDDYNTPLDPICINAWQNHDAYFGLATGIAGRMTMKRVPDLLQRLIEAPTDVHQHIVVVPVCVFWGRGRSHKDSLLQALTSEQRSATAGFKRFLGLVFSRGDVHVCFGKSVPLAELAAHERGSEFAARRAARLLRRRFKAMQFFTLGPDHSHRRTLLAHITRAPRVRNVISQLTTDQPATPADRQRSKLERAAYKIAQTIASDMTYRTLRLFRVFLSWFWQRIYSGINVRGLETLAEVNDTHTLVYVPSHRSHIDYLVLSYSLFKAGVMLPHIAAGDNLNLPVVGRLLRQGGAFFMRRSFRDDRLYAAVFEEYLYQVFASGHSVEFFPEGGRSRSGRLLSPKYGLLKLCLEQQLSGLPKPLAFVPIYFGYEKVIESGSYLRELRGHAKQKENLLGVVTNLQLVRQNFGQLQVNLAAPIKLDEWLQQNPDEPESASPNQNRQLTALGRAIMERINQQASISPVNLLALVLTDRNNLTIERDALCGKIRCFQMLATTLYGPQVLTDNVQDSQDCIDKTVALGFVSRHATEDWITCSTANATLLTWYRNNVLHLFALPALIALLVSRSPQGISEQLLTEQVAVIYPFIAEELTCSDAANTDAVLEALVNQGLLRRNRSQIIPPSRPSEGLEHLSQLGSLMLEILQRMYVVICIASHGRWNRQELQHHSASVSRKLSRLFGLPGAEFSDQSLFDNFVDGLLSGQWLQQNQSGYLTPANDLQAVADSAAERILDPPLLFALQRAVKAVARD